jgi:glycosyltransferase involved in cell wall biosynthesis
VGEPSTAGAGHAGSGPDAASARRLRIALVGLTHPFRGGIAQYTTLLCLALAERHEVRFFALSRQYPKLLFPGTTQIDRSETAFRVAHEACVDSINPFTWLSTAVRIARYRPDLVLFSWWHPFFAPAFGTIARLARWFGGVPSCYLCHNAVPHERTWLDALLLRYAFGSAQAFIAHSAQDRDDLRAMRPRARILHSPHPTYAVFAAQHVPTEAEAKARLGLSGRRVLLFFGFVRAYKGLVHLLEAMRELAPEEGYHLLVVGEFYEDAADYREALDRLSRLGQLTLVDRYVPNEEVPRYFAASDLVLAPYLSATQSGVVQLAYAFHKPVVATTVGGLPEVVREGSTGYLVPPGDPHALAAAARAYFATDRERMRREIEAENAQYSWERMVTTVERVCRELGR